MKAWARAPRPGAQLAHLGGPYRPHAPGALHRPGQPDERTPAADAAAMTTAFVTTQPNSSANTHAGPLRAPGPC
jgi:hypothetical protein